MKELELVPFLEPPSDTRELGVELVCLLLELGLDIRIVADRNAGAPIQRLYDFKAINQCKLQYKPTQTERCEPVNKRAAEIPDEYIKKLREKDRRYHNTANGEVGPMNGRNEN